MGKGLRCFFGDLSRDLFSFASGCGFGLGGSGESREPLRLHHLPQAPPFPLCSFFGEEPSAAALSGLLSSLA